MGVSPAEMEAKMAALPGKSGGGVNAYDSGFRHPSRNDVPSTLVYNGERSGVETETAPHGGLKALECLGPHSHTRASLPLS